MTTTQKHTQANRLPENVPDNIASPRGKLIYYFIKANNGVTREDIAKQLNCKYIEVLSILNVLQEHGHITQNDNTFY